MSIPIVSMNASLRLPSSQKATQPAAADNVQRTASTSLRNAALVNALTPSASASASASASVGALSKPVFKTPAAQTAADVKDDADKLSAKQVQHSLEEINKVMMGLSISVQFKIDPNFKELIVRVVDEDSGKLIRQIPTEEVVKMSKAMDNLKGLLFAQSV